MLPVLDSSIPIPKLCLNMIVKNESKIIKRLLLSVCSLIDTYCICDTGSTDNTIEIIETFFKEKNIPGKVIQEPFQDFGYNRSYALKACETIDADYILLLDADMIFWRNLNISPENFKRYLTYFDLFYMYQGTDTFYYKNTRIVKNNFGCSYWGVTHEYVNTPPHTRTGQLDKDVCFIRDIGDGGSKTNKFLRDVALLRKGLEKEPNNDRYTFYLANSLKDSGQKLEAIETYKKRIEIGGWIEEVWYSYYNIGRCYQELGNMDSAVCAWLQAYEAYPNRIENLFEIVQYYRVIGKQKLAQKFYNIAKESRDKYKERDYLFMQKDIYDYKLDYEMSIFGFYQNPEKIDLAKMSMDLLIYPHIEEGIARNILSNYKFYSKNISTLDTGSWKEGGMEMILNTIGKDLEIPSEKYEHFSPSTPTFCMHPTKENTMFVNKRFVNYYINDEGGYDNHEHIETKNVLCEISYDPKNKMWKKEREDFLNYDTKYDDRYVGLEDVRIMPFEDKIYYTANRGLGGNKMVIEHGWFNCINFSTEDVKHLTYEKQHQIEKNWVMYPDGEQMKVVYNWNPVVIGIVNGSEFKVINQIKTPYLFRFIRGSTNGIIVKNEIWFLCHVVSYEDRRYYYHIMVMMDRATHAIRYSRMFTFDREKVEYSLGMTYNKNTDELLIGYSVMDRTTKFISIRRDEIEKMA